LYLLFRLIRRPPRTPLFPYTTLFRSFHREPPPGLQITDDGVILGKPTAFGSFLWTVNVKDASGGPGVDCPIRFDVPRHWGLTVRSEEHTSELQSRENLVCRLLLEKKN